MSASDAAAPLLLLLFELRGLTFEIGVQVFGSLVFGEERDHLLQADDPLFGAPGLPESLLRFPVFGGCVRRHISMVHKNTRSGKAREQIDTERSQECAPRRIGLYGSA